MKVTRIGGPTILVELADWRILIDPTFDPPGRRYPFALGTSSVKTRGPSITPESIGTIDIVLLSHDHHADNLDAAGRTLLPSASHIVTTRSGARRLALPQAHGLAAGESVLLELPGKEPLRVTATPARHGPPFSRPIVGEVTGFAVRRQSHHRNDLWVTGDTVLTRRLRRFTRVLPVDVAIVNAGGVRFGATGPLRYTMTGAQAVELIAQLRPVVAIPAHYDGWSHFKDGETGVCTAVQNAPLAVRKTIRWLPDGRATDLTEQLNTAPSESPERKSS